MTSVNEENAIVRERARIREAVCTLEHFIKDGDELSNVMVRRSDVLAIINPANTEFLQIAATLLGASPTGDEIYTHNFKSN